MRRVLAISSVLLASGLLVFIGTGASTSSAKHYLVRAEFRNAFSVIAGEDVKIAGVRVGSIKSVDVTKRRTAAVVLDITEPGFQDFRSDAECTIRPQSLIGEKFVECTPTQPHPGAAAQAPSLAKITSGDGKGQYRLGLANTSRPVDLDLVNNILRLPYRQRLSLLLNEFGIGLAGRGADIQQVIRNADPALKQTDRVLKILAGQNRVLAKLASDSDTVLAPLARERSKVADFIVQANTTAEATAERKADLERSIQRLPQFLRELRPTLTQLGSLSEQASPVLRDLGVQAPQINRVIKQLGPFSAAGTPAFKALGRASVPGRVALVKSLPIVRDLRSFASEAKPLSANLRDLLVSFKDTGGIERLLDYAFYQTAAINGYDQYGHYLRAQLVVNLCSTYQTTSDPACAAKFTSSSSATRASAAQALAAKDSGRSPALARTDAVLRGMSPEDVLGAKTATKIKDLPGKQDAAAPAPIALPEALLPGGEQQQPAAPAPAVAPSDDPRADAIAGLLEYLLGGGPR